jgi:integrase
LLVLLAMWCQLRRGELSGLRRRDLDGLRESVSIERSRTFTRKGHSVVNEPKTTAGRRTLTIPANVLEAIDDHLERFVAADPDALVFTGKTGVPLTAGVLQKA